MSSENKAPRVLFLMPTKTYRANAFLAAANKLQLDIVVGTERQQALQAFTPGKTLTLNFLEPTEAAETIVRYAAQQPVAAIIAVDEDTAVVAAKASQALGLPHNSPEAAIAAREKHRMRKLLAAAGLASPNFKVVSIKDAPESIAKAVAFPCVLKPIFLSSSRGIIRANDEAEFVEAFHRIEAILKTPEIVKQGKELSNYILVEDFIPGEEVVLEGIFTNSRLNVLAIFDKPDPLVGPYFEETIYATPSRLPQETQSEIANSVSTAARAMGIRHGPVHAELRINESDIRIVEIAARSIGGLCSQALRFNAGMSLEELILRHAVGENIDNLKREALAAGVMMIPIPKAGMLKEVRGLEEAKSVTGIEDIRITIPLSQEVIPLPEGNRYLGFIFARTEKPSEVESALREAHRRLQFIID